MTIVFGSNQLRNEESGTLASAREAAERAFRARMPEIVLINGREPNGHDVVRVDDRVEFVRPESHESRTDIVDRIYGKYAWVRTSSEEFCARKQEEIDLEDRRWKK